MNENMEVTIQHLSAFGKVLSDPTRQRIMQLCCCVWKNVGELAVLSGMAQSTVSHHLAVLSDAGLVHVRHQGKTAFYTLNQQAIYQCCQISENLYSPLIQQTQARNEEENL
jgi:DNA-binding transcriptional ArsR family regulator